MVRWLKGWDPCVFGRPAPAPPAQQGGGGPGGGRGGGASGGGAAAGHFKRAAPPDPLGRPEHKVILIAGPPGKGQGVLPGRSRQAQAPPTLSAPQVAAGLPNNRRLARWLQRQPALF